MTLNSSRKFFYLLKIPLEILTHSTPQKWCHVEGPALLLFYSRNSSFCLPNSDLWYRCRIWYSIIQRFIQIHLFSRQIYWNFQLLTFFLPPQMISSVFDKESKYAYHNLMYNLGIITDKGEPCVLSYVFKVGCNWGSSRKFWKTSTFCLVPNFFKVKSCKWTSLYFHSDNKDHLTSLSVSWPPFLIKLYTILV